MLKETTNREGFVEDEFFHMFKQILDDAIKRINRNRKRLNDAMRKYISDSVTLSGKAEDNTLSFKPTISRIREEIEKATPLTVQGKVQIATALDNYKSVKEAVDNAPFIPAETTEKLNVLYQNIESVSAEYTRLINERDSLNNKLDAISLDFEKINERLQDLFELAGLGISVELFAHEFDASIRNVKAKINK